MFKCCLYRGLVNPFSYTKGAFVWEYSEIRMYSGIYAGYSAPGSRIARMESGYSGMRIAHKQTLTCIIPIILIPDWSQTNAPLASSQAGLLNWRLKETKITTKHNRLTNINWREADQLAIYKHERGVELLSTEKQLQWSERDLNLRPPDFRSGTLTTRPRCLQHITNAWLRAHLPRTVWARNAFCRNSATVNWTGPF